MSSTLEYAWFLWDSVIVDLFRSKGPFFTKENYPDLTGQTWVVTGATGGIGFEIAKVLVGLNASVWIVGRNEAKLADVLETLRKAKPLAKVDSVIIDFNDLTTVKPGAQKILQSTKRLDGIIHNAAVMNTDKEKKTKQGFELHLGVNNLATQLLQDLLDPLIEKTPNGRIIWISSLGSALSPTNGFDFERVESLAPLDQYGQSKALNYIQAAQWTRKHPNADVKCIAVHPGVIKTDLGRSLDKWTRRITSLMEYDVEYGTYAPMYAALSPDAVNNEFVIHWGRQGTIRPDIYRAARNQHGVYADEWIEEKIAPFK